MSNNDDDHRRVSSSSSSHIPDGGGPQTAPIATPDEGAATSTPLPIPNNTRKRSPEEYTRNFDLNEISPLNCTANGNDRSEVNHNNGIGGPLLGVHKNGVGAEPVIVAMSTDETFASGTKNERRRFKGTYEEILGKLDLSEKARLPFVITVVLSVVLFVVVVLMIVFWPRIPDYMSAKVCVEKECLDASSQILLWANTSVSACDRPYEWACGRFEADFDERSVHHGLANNGGEWTVESSAEYDELLQIHSFVAKLPTSVASSAQLMLTRLHADCMRMDTIDKAQADFALGKAIRSLSEWVYGKDWVANGWDFRRAMITAHSRYGLSPFFKVSMKNLNSAPYGSIITVSEGSLGLPHKMFYNLSQNHRIIAAYKMLLRDFAINFGTVAEVAKKFADEMFYFEKRIVNAPTSAERRNVIMTLGEVHKLAPTLPIFETITMTFSNTKLDEQTPIWIEDVAMLKEMSIIVSTTDVAPLNSFLVWSLSRHFMPFMSSDYRAALDEFNSVIYGHKSTTPAWLVCAKLLHDWVPFAVDTLRFNPELIVSQQPSTNMFDIMGLPNSEPSQLSSERLVRDRLNYDHEMLRLIFAHLRHQMQLTVDANVAIEQDATKFIINQLSKVRLHIGLPVEATKAASTINTYFADFLWRKLNFIDHLESRWTFSKKKMEEQLVARNLTEKWIAQLYPAPIRYGERLARTQYSIDMNSVTVSEVSIHKPYFHYKYPISVNFARIGVHLSRSLLDAVIALGVQFNQHMSKGNQTRPPFSFGDLSCLESKANDPSIPTSVRKSIALDLEATRFTVKAFAEFQHHLQTNRPVLDSGLPDLLTYDLFGLRTPQRQAGLRALDDGELFALATLQSHCGHSPTGYAELKPFVESRLSESEFFNIAWHQIHSLAKNSHCTTSTRTSAAERCDSVL